MSNISRALVVEDDENSAAAIAKVVASLGYETTVAGTLQAAKVELNARAHAMVFLDIGLPDGNGLDLIESFEGDQKPHFIVITGNNSREVVINSLRANVTDFLEKPVSLNDLKSCVLQLTSTTDKAEHRPDQLPPLPINEDNGNHTVVFKGSSKLVAELRSNVLHCARTNLDSVIIGDVGVDKLGVAYGVHVKSDRTGKYVCVEPSDFELNAFNSPAGSAHTDLSALIKSWLNVAMNGTLTITDLTSIPLTQQRLLSRSLGVKPQIAPKAVGDNGRLNSLPPRIIGLLNEPWDEAVERGKLIPELYHRLAQYAIKVPKLVDRIEDVVDMAESIIGRLNREYKTNKILADESVERLKQYAWPGHLMELGNILTQSFASSVQTIVVDPGLIPGNNTANREEQTIDSLVGKSFWQVEKTLLFATLEHNNGDKAAAAKSLGISLKTLYNRLNAYS